MVNYRLDFSYNGSKFFGYQLQQGLRTVEGEIRQILSQLFGSLDTFVSSGRTDRGVHASNQVVNFKTQFDIPDSNVARYLSDRLPSDIVLNQLSRVDESFHSRFSAKYREYVYLFSFEHLPLYLNEYVSIVQFDMDDTLFQKCLDYIIGQHDFVNFRTKGSNEKSTIRTVYSASIRYREIPDLYTPDKLVSFYEMTITANSFLYNMVRNIVGTIFEVLKHKLSLSDFYSLIDQGEKLGFVKKAPAHGLTLVNIHY